jgi:pimeloyl-ACP methyl ester carboxylesterase
MQRLLLATLLLLAGCGATAPAGSPVSDGGLRWGDGPYGLVLVPDAGRDAASWSAEASTLADDGMTVVAVDSSDATAIEAALRYLLETRGLDRAALLGAGAGADSAIAVAAERPELVDQLIVLSASGDVSALGDMPKLFVASSGEQAAADATRMANQASGQWNELYLAEGDASGQAILAGDGRAGTMDAILRRLDERR